MHVLVTGAAGYIGRHVVTALADRGADVTAVVRGVAAQGLVDPRAAVVDGDIFSGDLLEPATVPDVVVHLAWEAGFVHNHPAHMERLSDHYRFLAGLSELGVRRIVALGTMHEVGYHEGPIDESTPTRPTTLYGVAKDALRRAMEIRLAGETTQWLWLRCFYITGDDARSNSVFAKMLGAAAEGRRTFPFTSGTALFDFIDVADLGDQIAAAALQDSVLGIVNCCSGEPQSLGERAERFIAERGLDLDLEYGAFPDRPGDSPGVWGDASRIRAILAAERR
ncbi:NAD(P)-dependent oxidoreductase [Cellulomonas sp. URHD0024]|uniref:NAD-dependent epimerase/dehydratase family protein n=1 Tax=Cellulomonas sp. URHD0024 TaxID=1302620 RepID=UPI0003FBC079|nr:NAD(P)-dependent oxidoreductase [Cellulomonas sp. URHD0024]